MSMGCRYLNLTFLTIASLVVLAAAQQGAPNGSPRRSDSAAKPSSTLSARDQRFIKDAAEEGMAEVELGRLAQLKGSSDDVKQFGQRMVDDHGKANDKLKELAAAKGITLPEGPTAKQKTAKTRLLKLSGVQFDGAYMMDMVQDHKKDVAAFRIESKSGQDPEVKSFATDTLPTLRDHLKAAQSVEPKVVQAR